MSHVVIGPRVLNLLQKAFPTNWKDSLLTESVAVVSLEPNTHVRLEFSVGVPGRGKVTVDKMVMIEMILDPTVWEDYVGFVSLAKGIHEAALDAKLVYWTTLMDIQKRGYTRGSH